MQPLVTSGIVQVILRRTEVCSVHLSGFSEPSDEAWELWLFTESLRIIISDLLKLFLPDAFPP